MDSGRGQCFSLQCDRAEKDNGHYGQDPGYRGAQAEFEIFHREYSISLDGQPATWFANFTFFNGPPGRRYLVRSYLNTLLLTGLRLRQVAKSRKILKWGIAQAGRTMTGTR